MFFKFRFGGGDCSLATPTPFLVSQRIRMHRSNYRKWVVEMGSSLTRLKVVFYASLWY
jgi:hypothetical protein